MAARRNVGRFCRAKEKTPRGHVVLTCSRGVRRVKAPGGLLDLVILAELEVLQVDAQAFGGLVVL